MTPKLAVIFTLERHNDCVLDLAAREIQFCTFCLLEQWSIKSNFETTAIFDDLSQIQARRIVVFHPVFDDPEFPFAIWLELMAKCLEIARFCTLSVKIILRNIYKFLCDVHGCQIMLIGLLVWLWLGLDVWTRFDFFLQEIRLSFSFLTVIL